MPDLGKRILRRGPRPTQHASPGGHGGLARGDDSRAGSDTDIAINPDAPPGG